MQQQPPASNAHAAEIVVANRQGLHARPVTEFVQLAHRFQSDVKVTKDGTTVDGKSVMSMLTLGAARGATLRIEANGPDAVDVVGQLAELIRKLPEKEDRDDD